MPYVDPMKPDVREAKLPVWAKEMIVNLRRRTVNAETDRAADRLATKPGESDALIDRHDDIPIGLGPRPKITFVLSRDEQGKPVRTIEVRLSRDYPGTLELMGSSTMHIRPQVTNVIQVWTARD
jgi:hypothetical protein